MKDQVYVQVSRKVDQLSKSLDEELKKLEKKGTTYQPQMIFPVVEDEKINKDIDTTIKSIKETYDDPALEKNLNY